MASVTIDSKQFIKSYVNAMTGNPEDRRPYQPVRKRPRPERAHPPG
jgi:hypothetical protein